MKRTININTSEQWRIIQAESHQVPKMQGTLLAVLNFYHFMFQSGLKKSTDASLECDSCAGFGGEGLYK